MMFPSDPFTSTLRPGHQLGRFRIVERIGGGGMATVYRALDEKDAPVALKVMEPGAFEAEDRARFRREFVSLAALAHPNVVRVYEAGTTDAREWLAMEFVDGVDLEAQIASWRAADAPDRFDRAEQIFRGMLHALQYVHDHGLVHRDLKPGNILLTAKGEPKLSDFGVVKATEGSQITVAGRLIGTIAYMAPELIADEGVDARTDLYGLGAVLYSLLTLERPIEAETLTGYLAQHLTRNPTPPHELDPTVPRHLERVCLRLLEKDPARRYPTARATLEALDGRDEGALRFLHGRQGVLSATERWLDGVASGRAEVVFVTGPAGSGRSSVLQHLKLNAEARGLSVATLTAAAPGLTARVLCVDDVHECGPEVARRVHQLVHSPVRQPATLLVLTGPPELPRQVLGRAPVEPSTVATLDPLDARSITAILRDRGLPTPPATALGQRLAGNAAAQPGPLHELVDALTVAEWLVPTTRGLRSTRRLADYRTADLPISEQRRAALTVRLQALDPEARDLLELLVLLGRAEGAALLGRALGSPPRLPALVDGLLQQGLITVRDDEDDRTLELGVPGVPTLLLSVLPAERRRQHHLALANALRRSRRHSHVNEERAAHLSGAGLHAEAYPLWMRAVQQAQRDRRYHDALRLLDEADQTLRHLPNAEPVQLALASLSRGSALLALGHWERAEPPLAAAVTTFRSLNDPAQLAVGLAELGRARYHCGDRGEARALIEEALRLGPPDDLHLARAACALADIHLHGGALDDAEQHLRAAAATAVRQGARDAEARARRGLAHMHGLRGDLVQASAELDHAEELLLPNGSTWVRVGVLIHSVELDLAAGRLGTALLHGEQLTELASIEDTAPLLPLALSLAATVHLHLGRARDAHDLARRAITVAAHQTRVPWQGRFRACRVLLAEGQPLGAALDNLRIEPEPGLYDPQGQLLALRARAVSRDRPAEARAMLQEALSRPRAAWVLSHWHLVLDAAKALGELGERADALALIDRTLPLIDQRRADGVKLEAALLRHRLGDASAAEQLGELVDRVSASVSARDRLSFLRRPDLQPFVAHGAALAASEASPHRAG